MGTVALFGCSGRSWISLFFAVIWFYCLQQARNNSEHCALMMVVARAIMRNNDALKVKHLVIVIVNWFAADNRAKTSYCQVPFVNYKDSGFFLVL